MKEENVCQFKDCNFKKFQQPEKDYNLQTSFQCVIRDAGLEIEGTQYLFRDVFKVLLTTVNSFLLKSRSATRVNETTTAVRFTQLKERPHWQGRMKFKQKSSLQSVYAAPEVKRK